MQFYLLFTHGFVGKQPLRIFAGRCFAAIPCLMGARRVREVSIVYNSRRLGAMPFGTAFCFFLLKKYCGFGIIKNWVASSQQSFEDVKKIKGGRSP